MRICEHKYSDSGFTFQRMKKIIHKSLANIDVNSIHTAISSSNYEVLILVDKKNMYIYDLKGMSNNPEEPFMPSKYRCC